MNNSEGISISGNISPFEQIRRTNDAGAEYWSSRDFAGVLGYTDYRNFEQVLGKAQLACFNSGQRIEDHFVDITEMIEIGKGGQREVKTVLLSRYACYLIVQNADPGKEIVALGQTYFAVQTRRQELSETGHHHPGRRPRDREAPGRFERRTRPRLPCALQKDGCRRPGNHHYRPTRWDCRVDDRRSCAPIGGKKSKPIIDEIDTTLAGQYGFTDEELDFPPAPRLRRAGILNYDIKYRLGRDAGEEE